MASARVLVVRGSLLLNAVLVLYLCLAWLATTPTHPNLPAEGVSLQLSSLQDADQGSSPLDLPPLAVLVNNFDEAEVRDISLGGRRTLGQLPEQVGGVEQVPKASIEQVPQVGLEQMPHSGGVEAGGGEPEEPPREVQESVGVTEQLVVEPLAMEPLDPPLDSQEHKIYPDLRDCTTRPQRPFYYQRGDYWGPVSVAVYAPGTDFNATLNTILYLRDCWAEGIKKYVTFHLFFHVSHTPKKVPSTDELLKRKTDCALEPPRWTNVTTYRQQRKLLYPVNVARNTARQAVQTYFVFPSDVELYPSINFITEFFKMLKQPDKSNTTSPRVYVFSIFEVKENISVPETKTDLQKLLKKGDAIPFHKHMYILCVRDYELHILDNAFLVHKPGIKKLHKDPFRDRIVAKQNSAISSKILPEYKTVFGTRKSCVI
ncbi:Beta-1-4-glucuronyltransferase 1-like 1 [Homarus americanus]|uniref:Beta-1-4-glucuronyltransferase 1-like 1 n=1 Tax=Homarus americanus TaxID=6706 RepID=A0A8J5N965_HOMAM|nr:Beta-1-4-glucuronyltransferase 1-like 1 [Homarus americanus]